MKPTSSDAAPIVVAQRYVTLEGGRAVRVVARQGADGKITAALEGYAVTPHPRVRQQGNAYTFTTDPPLVDIRIAVPLHRLVELAGAISRVAAAIGAR